MFSVVIPAYNATETLGQTLHSLSCQVEQPFETIVVDNNSTDGTRELALSYGDRLRICVVGEPRQGISFALNTGADAARSEWIARIDSDDIAVPDWLKMARQFIETESVARLMAFSFAYRTFGEGVEPGLIRHPVTPDAVLAALLFCSPVAHPGSIIRSSIVRRVRYRDVAAEDHDLWCRIATFGSICNLPDVGVEYRVSRTSLSARKALRIRASTRMSGIRLMLSHPRRLLNTFRTLELADYEGCETIPLERLRRVRALARVLTSD